MREDIPEYGRYDVAINSAGSVLCEPNWRWTASRQSPDYDLLFIWAGEGWAVFEEEALALLPGMFICLRPGSRYQARHNPQNRLGVCYIHFEFRDVAGQGIVLPEETAPPRYCRTTETDFIGRVIRQVVSDIQYNNPLHRLRAATCLRTALLSMAATSHDRQSANRQRFSEVARSIAENPGYPWSLSDLASMVNCSPDYFARQFKSIYGVTPKAYCVHTRLSRACELLIDTEMTIQQIANDLGYVDLFFFSRQFKARYGLPPSHWRSSHRE